MDLATTLSTRPSARPPVVTADAPAQGAVTNDTRFDAALQHSLDSRGADAPRHDRRPAVRASRAQPSCEPAAVQEPHADDLAAVPADTDHAASAAAEFVPAGVPAPGDSPADAEATTANDPQQDGSVSAAPMIVVAVPTPSAPPVAPAQVEHTPRDTDKTPVVSAPSNPSAAVATTVSMMPPVGTMPSTAIPVSASVTGVGAETSLPPAGNPADAAAADATPTSTPNARQVLVPRAPTAIPVSTHTPVSTPVPSPSIDVVPVAAADEADPVPVNEPPQAGKPPVDPAAGTNRPLSSMAAQVKAIVEQAMRDGGRPARSNGDTLGASPASRSSQPGTTSTDRQDVAEAVAASAAVGRADPPPATSPVASPDQSQAIARALMRATVEGLVLPSTAAGDAAAAPGVTSQPATSAEASTTAGLLSHSFTLNPALMRHDARAAYLAEQAAGSTDAPVPQPIAAAAEAFLNQQPPHDGQGHAPYPDTARPGPETALVTFALSALGATDLASPGSAASTPLSSSSPATTMTELPRQILRSIQVQVRDGVSEARLRLNPEHLGEVTVRVRVDSGGVTAILHAESPQVSGWIAAHEEELRSALTAQGLQLDRFTVTTDPDDRRDAQEHAPRPRPKAPRARGEAKTFQLTV